MLDSFGSSPRAQHLQKNFWRVLVLAFLVLFFGPPLVRLYVDALWFGSLGYNSVFARSWQTRLLLFFAFFIATTAILKFAFTLIERAYAKYALGDAVVRLENQDIKISPQKILKPAAQALALFTGLVSGFYFSARWQEWLKFLYQAPTADRDAVFKKPLGFYLFDWPVYSMIVGWMAWMTVLIFIVAVAWAVFAYVSRLPRSVAENARRTSFATCSLALAGVLLVLALRTYLSRFALVWEDGETFSGVGYLEAHVTLPSLLILIGVLALGALLLLWNALRVRNLKIFAIALALPIATQILSGVVSRYVANFVVKPNELQLQTPYIRNNMDATRRAFNLQNVETRPFAATPTVAAFDATRERSTLDNVRLWDWRALQAALNATQALKAYYDFPDVDVDRYVINGKARQVMIAARELDIEKIPSRNWINEKLIYTHGYGLTMNTASGFTADGRPLYVVSEMPLRSNASEVKVTRPEIYFGQKTDSHVYVATRQKEYDYPQGDEQDKYSTYQGEGGIALGGGLRRFLIASALGDISKIPFSDDVTSESRVLLHRQIMERAQLLAPFLLFDGDPYLVVTRAGRLVWILDAYTASMDYPNATYYGVAGGAANYMRGSVKVTIDAYDGATNFYVFDPNDAVLAAWRGAFPQLFQDSSKMPADLRSHVRYPEGLFRVQSEVYGLYHSTNAANFFSRGDLWSVARLGDTGTSPTPSLPASPLSGMPGAGPVRVTDNSSPIEPAFLLMALPDEKPSGARAGEFVLTVPFTAASKTTNMSAWLAGRSDGANYGTLRAYQFARGVDVAAPQQIRSRINSETSLSKELTLWDSPDRGSRILWGNLLTIPLGRGLLYVQPIFLQAESSPIPELKIVVLATPDTLVYAPTYAEALQKLLGASPASQPSTPATSGAQPKNATPKTSSQQGQLIQRAARELADYQRLTSQGKYGEAGQKLESLQKSLQELQQR